MLVVGWEVSSHSESVLIRSDVLSDFDSSCTRHLGSDLELTSVSEWLLGHDLSSLVKPPALAEIVVTVVEDDVSVVGVGISLDSEALSSVVLEVSS